jgi:hypothetical protein
MEDDASPYPSGAAGDSEPSGAAGDPADDPVDTTSPPAPSSPTAPTHHWSDATEHRLRRIIGRRGIPYDGPIDAITRGWVSREGKFQMFAARFLDFAVLTPEYLMFCSTGFFSRLPRRGVFRESLNRLVVVALPPDPARTLRIVGDFGRPLLFEVRADTEGKDFAYALIDATHADARSARLGAEGEAGTAAEAGSEAETAAPSDATESDATGTTP